MEGEATMIDEARRVSTVLEFHLTEARKLVERLESLEEIAVQRGEAERVGPGPLGGAGLRGKDIRGGRARARRRDGFKKILAATLRRLRG
jgi:hypothetical protein